MEHTVLESITSCAICGASPLQPVLRARDHTVSQETFTIAECPDCKAWFTNPRPDQNSIGSYYRSNSYISHTNASATFQDKLYQVVRRRALEAKRKLISRYRPNGRLLDVGCGTGQFIGHMKAHGYLVTGVEPDTGARGQAIADQAAEVLPNLDQIPSAEQFHVVTMWHVLEHVPDLRRTLKKLYSVMADRGFLFIAVPDRESWDATHYGSDWAALDVPRHLNHLRRSDMNRLFQEHGFALKAVRPMWFDAPYISMLTEQHRGAGPITALLKGTLVGAWSNLLALASDRPTSSSLYIAQKQEP
ncbi:MAG: class I SAM-dependent methyltransferase [Flavobacteriales bacterium]|nr:class I SAM-dependent methyltransferase [Flavobacteriales bacterium]